jgi:hypothetical protein
LHKEHAGSKLRVRFMPMTAAAAAVVVAAAIIRSSIN